MAIQLADVELLDPRLRQEALLRPGDNGREVGEDSGRLAPSRGIMIAVLLSAPIWAVIGITIYFLVS